VGLLVWQAGFDLVFVDRDPTLVTALQQAGSYTVKLYGSQYQEITVSGYRVFHSEQRPAIAQEIVDADLVLTAVFDQNLPDVAATLALAVATCRQAGRAAPLNCIACENMMDSSSVLGRHVKALLTGADLEYCATHFGFPDCMISRVVPRPGRGEAFLHAPSVTGNVASDARLSVPAGSPGNPTGRLRTASPLLTLVAEDYNEWTARAEDFLGPRPARLTALELVENQTARLERKLFIHNGGHAVCGYVGYHRGHRYIHEAVADPVVARHVLGALDELGEVVRRKHGFPAESIAVYKQDLVRRGSVPEMRDEILRVVRDPVRKLSPRERLVAPALLAVEYGLPRQWIVKGIIAALKYAHPGDPQSMVLADQLARLGLAEVLARVCQIPPSSPLTDEILAAWPAWEL
jgi:mannitol-1-phosphate 5-dehydrogenase